MAPRSIPDCKLLSPALLPIGLLAKWQDCIGIVENRMETTIIGYILGLYRDNGQEKCKLLYCG